jgi:hypothetical protein
VTFCYIATKETANQASIVDLLAYFLTHASIHSNRTIAVPISFRFGDQLRRNRDRVKPAAGTALLPLHTTKVE